MKWIEFAVYTTDAGIEAVCGALAAIGIEQVSIEESSARVAAFLEATAKYWDFADADALAAKNGPCVKAYISQVEENVPLLEAARQSIERLRQLNTGMDLGPLAVQESIMDEEDWANSWKAYYKPQPIGERLLVCPSWEEVDPRGRVVVKMDPGMVFGTGTHHTTRMCLEALEEKIQGGETILDVGCGSGILAIAGLLLGAKDATLVDIDPVAQRVVQENAQLNHIDDQRCRILIGDVLVDDKLRSKMDGAYDVVVANIVADVIIALCPYIPRYIKPGGWFLCSGIIDERQADVVAALRRNGFRILEEKTAEGWVALVASREANDR